RVCGLDPSDASEQSPIPGQIEGGATAYTVALLHTSDTRRRLGRRAARRPDESGGADTPDHRKLQRGRLHLDTEVQSEHIELDAFLPADREPGEPEERELNARAARRRV